MAFVRPERFVERVFLHCSASDNPDHDDVAVMRRWHTDPKPQGRGWSDVGYHFFVRKDGRVQKGRSLERNPAAQAGHNSGTIAICLHGLAAEKFTEAQHRAVVGLCSEIHGAYDGMVTFHGHGEVSSKPCPVFPYREVLGLDGHGNMGLAPTAGLVAGRAATPVLRLMDSGPAVARLQTLLGGRGADLAVDGIFGQMTRTALVRFQADKGLAADGIAGPDTWAALEAGSG